MPARAVRVAAAITNKLLAESSNKIETLAKMCGYQSINSFCIAFKRTTGMSAKRYRETIRY